MKSSNLLKICGWIFFSLWCLSFTSFAALSQDPSLPIKILDKNIPRNNPRYKTFQYILQLMTEREVRVLVETGTARYGNRNFLGDGGSTLIFGEWASQHHAILYSVDIDKNALFQAERALNPVMKAHVRFIESDSIEFLSNFDQKIDFLYLDSYDFEIKNPLPSQQHHLKEIIAAYPLLTPKSIVMIDDCDLPHGGKGKLVIEYLIDKGWKIAAKGYQVILIR